MRAVIIGAARSGGVFLASCLSNHPDIFCPRDEIFNPAGIWQKSLKLPPSDLFEFVFSVWGFEAVVIRLTYGQSFNPEVSNFILKNNIKIIHLTRMILPNVTSALLAKLEQEKGTPRHWVKNGFKDNEVLEVSPAHVIEQIDQLIFKRKKFNEVYGSNRLELQYEEITKLFWLLPQEQAERICHYLEISPARMITNQRKMHTRNLESYYKNWNDIKLALESAFPDLVVI